MLFRAARRGGTFRFGCADCSLRSVGGLSRDIASDADFCARSPRFRARRRRLAASRPMASAISISPPASPSMRSAMPIRIWSRRLHEQAHEALARLQPVPDPGSRAASPRGCATQSFADFVFFCNSGAEAMECAIKMRAQIPRRERPARALSHHHLRRRVPRPHAGDARRRRPEEISRRLRPAGRRLRPGAVRRSRGRQEARSARRPRRILIEPMQGEGGVRVVAARLPPGAARALRRARPAAGLRRGADRHGPHRRAVRLSAHRRRRPTSWRSPRRSAAASRSARAWPPREAAKGMTAGTHGSTFGGNPLAMARPTPCST